MFERLSAWVARLFWTRKQKEQDIINSLLLPSLKIPALVKKHKQAWAILKTRENGANNVN